MKLIIVGCMFWGIALLLVWLIVYMSKKKNDAYDDASKKAFKKIMEKKENCENVNVGSYRDYRP